MAGKLISGEDAGREHGLENFSDEGLGTAWIEIGRGRVALDREHSSGTSIPAKENKDN